MPKFYCEYCGQEFRDVRSLTAGKCSHHPAGFAKGPHKLYEGSEKSSYTCKYCGQQYRSLRSMAGSKCSRHPDGFAKGPHSPAL